jgi:PAS domain S-box-containing protein
VDRIASIRIVALYALFGSLWILFSDTILGHITRNQNLMQRISVFKGLVFVLITSFLLYLLINRHVRRMSDVNSHLQSSMDHLQTILEKLKLTDLSIDNISDSILWITMDTHFWNVNRAACSMLGYSREEFLSLSISDIDPHFTLEEWQTHLQEIRQSGSIKLLSKFHKSKAGQIFPVEIVLNYIKYNDVEYYCAIVRDITGRVKAEQEASFFRSLIEYTRDPFYVLSPDEGFRMVYANLAACEHYGMDLEQLQTMRIPDWDPLFDMGNIDALTRQHREGKSARFETVHRVASGKLIPVEVTSCILVHDGREYVCGYFYDITERKVMDKALKESEAKYRMLSLEYQALLDGIPDGLTLLSPDLTVLWANIVSASMTGMEQADLIGRHCYEVRHGSDTQCEECIVRDTFITGEARKTVIFHPPFSRTIELRSVPVKDEDGKIVKVIEVGRDVTEQVAAEAERLELENKLLHAHKLESLGILAGGIAHDFNNILTAILGNISLSRIQLQNPEKVAKRMEDAENAAVRAKDLTQQLLTFARGGDPVKKNIRVNSLLKEAAGFAIQGSAVKCEFALADNLWPVQADEGQLSQVIHNLVLNAVQAMPTGGKIAIVANNADSPAEGKRFVEITVADTGSGIPEHLLQKIFDPYFTTKHQGSGLGLATCYSIINKHDGYITVESTQYKGSTFHIFLPAAEQVEEAEPAACQDVACGKGRVLVMDDEEIVRIIAEASLEELGYLVECTKDGSAAVELYRKRKEEGNPFVAVIMDLTIPGGIGGKEAINLLMQIDPKVKVIVSSGYASDPVMANYREYGFSAVLCKPYRLQEISKALHELLDTDL